MLYHHHFKEGISKLKQVTGREHQGIQCYIVGVIAGAVPKRFLISVQALMDFCYLAQAPEISGAVSFKIKSALKEFHNHKDAIIASGAQNGKKGRIKAWQISKLKFLQSVIPNICDNGVAIQWSADITGCAHITEIKFPADTVNNQNYKKQTCCFLNCAEKCHLFDLATVVHEAGVGFHGLDSTAEGNDVQEDSEGHVRRMRFTCTRGPCPAWSGTPASRTPAQCSLRFTILEVAKTSVASRAIASCSATSLSPSFLLNSRLGSQSALGVGDTATVPQYAPSRPSCALPVPDLTSPNITESLVVLQSTTKDKTSAGGNPCRSPLPPPSADEHGRAVHHGNVHSMHSRLT
jgi:hypothetical protein